MFKEKIKSIRDNNRSKIYSSLRVPLVLFFSTILSIITILPILNVGELKSGTIDTFYGAIIQVVGTIYVFFFTILIILAQVSEGNRRIFYRFLRDPLNISCLFFVQSTFLIAIQGLLIGTGTEQIYYLILTLILFFASLFLLTSIVYWVNNAIKPISAINYEISQIQKKKKDLEKNKADVTEEIIEIRHIFYKNIEDDIFVKGAYSTLLTNLTKINNSSLHNGIISLGGEIASDSNRYQTITAILNTYIAKLKELGGGGKDEVSRTLLFQILRQIEFIGRQSKSKSDSESVVYLCICALNVMSQATVACNEKTIIKSITQGVMNLYRISPTANIREISLSTLELFAETIAEQETFSKDRFKDIEYIFDSIMKIKPKPRCELNNHIYRIVDAVEDGTLGQDLSERLNAKLEKG